MIKVDGVGKKYRLGSIDYKNLKYDLQKNNDEHIFWALKDVSFRVKKGEKVGIIGANGAGKSTLLKLISGITVPTEGVIYLNGKVSSMLEVGTGFYPELTGRENIYMNGTLLGMSKKEVDEKLEQIIDFSECREFIDTPVKRYSSGMYVRLAFAVAAFLESDITILDEVLAVGDVNFQKKCFEKINQVAATDGRTILFVSHNLDTLRKICDRCIVLEHGQVVFDGETEKAIAFYMGEDRLDEVKMDYSEKRRFLWLQRDDVRLQSVEYVGAESNHFTYGGKAALRFVTKYITETRNLGLRVEVRDVANQPVGMACAYNIGSGKANDVSDITVELNYSMLAEGDYKTIYTLFVLDSAGVSVDLDCVDGLEFHIEKDLIQKMKWKGPSWGYVSLPELKIIK